LLSETKLRQAFRYYDKDDGGSISLEELKEVLGVGQNITLEVWKVLVEEVDENGDGEIDFEEF
jgi:calcium-dependent protein kinase